MVIDEDMSSVIERLDIIVKQNSMLIEIQSALLKATQSNTSVSSSGLDPDIEKAVIYISLQPEEIMWSGKVSYKRLAKKVNCNKKKLYRSDVVRHALETIEGGPRAARKGHINIGVDAKGRKSIQGVDGVSEIDFDEIDRMLDGK